MFGEIGQLLASVWASLRTALEVFAWSAVAFGILALLIKGGEAIAAARRAAAEVRTNLTWYVLDAIFVAPVVAVLVHVMLVAMSPFLPLLPGARLWSFVGQPATLFAVVFIGDFISYWRHRMEHTRWLWPAHAIHHSDTEMTWSTIVRFHPVNRIVTACVDIAFLTLFGFPEWAIVANFIVRHYYGEFIHADLPWMYGPLKGVFVSPVMHRWHHARDVVGAGSNFATVFSVFDRMYGTYFVPGLCTVPLGVTDEMGTGTIRQLLYPFVAWGDEIRLARARRAEAAGQPAGAGALEKHLS